MATISARGEREVARWKHDESKSTYVLTNGGRLLWKSGVPGSGYTLRYRLKKSSPAFKVIQGRFRVPDDEIPLIRDSMIRSGYSRT